MCAHTEPAAPGSHQWWLRQHTVLVAVHIHAHKALTWGRRLGAGLELVTVGVGLGEGDAHLAEMARASAAAAAVQWQHDAMVSCSDQQLGCIHSEIDAGFLLAGPVVC